jgi:hypothetical protein
MDRGEARRREGREAAEGGQEVVEEAVGAEETIGSQNGRDKVTTVLNRTRGRIGCGLLQLAVDWKRDIAN